MVSSPEWSVTLDGEVVGSDERIDTRDVDAPYELIEEVDIYADAHIRFWARIRLVREYAHLEVLSAFLASVAQAGTARNDPLASRWSTAIR